MNKLLIVFTIAILTISCKDEKETILTNEYLGAPKHSDIHIRIIPANIISKNLPSIGDTSNNTKDTGDNLLKSLLESSPTLSDLGNNILSLNPDFSLSWLANLGITDSSKFVSIYFKIGKPEALEEYLKGKKITSLEQNGILTSWVDEQPYEHNLIVRQDNHLLLLKVLGDVKEAQRIVKDASYQSKKQFLSYYKDTFKSNKNDLDIRLTPGTPLATLIPNNLGKDIVKDFNGLISFQMNPSSIKLIIDPLDSRQPIDSILRTTKIDQQGIAAIGTSIDLEKLEHLLIKYDYLDDINYELKKINLSTSELKEISNGELNFNYLGKKEIQTKSITYQFDENFNEVEKVSYNKSSSLNIKGYLGSNTPTNTKNWLVKNKIITTTGRNKFEPTLLSKSTIAIEENKLTIGDTSKSDLVESKFLLKLDYSASDWSEIIPKKLGILDELESFLIKLEENNKLVIHISFTEKAYKYVKIIDKVMNQDISPQ